MSHDIVLDSWEAATAKFSLALAAKGNIRTTTLTTFTEAERRAITAAI